MYTTRPLSLYNNSPQAISIPPEGPNSGFLVLQDEESTPTSCFGLCKDASIEHLPFPQNKRLVVEYHVRSKRYNYHSYDEVYLIPVINHPLSSNRYYAIKADGNNSKGKAYASSKEDEKTTCCLCIPCIKDVKPRPFDSDDIYQQFVFYESKKTLALPFNNKILKAKSVASDGHPPGFLRTTGWNINARSLKNSTLGEARGVELSLRAQLPDLGFPVSQQYSKSVVVGKWYCLFMFIKEGTEKNQIEQSVFYEMTLEQRWERIFVAEKNYTQGNVVAVDVMVSTEMIKIAGEEAIQEERNEKGVVWFRTKDGRGVGVSSLIIERMKWEQERAGFVIEKERQVRVVKHEKHQGVQDWRSYGCYVLVETFVLKRNDGSVVLTYDFRHTHQVTSKWE